MNNQVTENWDDGDFDFQDEDQDSNAIHNHSHSESSSSQHPEDHQSENQNNILSDDISDHDSSDLELEIQLGAFDSKDHDQVEEGEEDIRVVRGVKELRESETDPESSSSSSSQLQLQMRSESNQIRQEGTDIDQEEGEEEEDEDQVDTIKLSSLASETLKSLKLASESSKRNNQNNININSNDHDEDSTLDQEPFTGTITRLNSRPSRNQRVDIKGGGDWDEDLEIPETLPNLININSKLNEALDLDFETNQNLLSSRRPRSFASELEFDISDDEECRDSKSDSPLSTRNQNRNSATSFSEDSNQSSNSFNLRSGSNHNNNGKGKGFGLHSHSNYTSTDWTTDSPSPELNNRSKVKRSEGISKLSFSDDVSSNNSTRFGNAGPESPSPFNSHSQQLSKTNPKGKSNTVLTTSSSSSKPQISTISIWQKDSDPEGLNLENDFDLSPQLLKLNLNPSIMRQKSMNTLEKERILWNEVGGASSGSLSSSPEIGSILDKKGKKSFTSANTTSTSEFDDPEDFLVDEDDDVDDEDLLEGLIFPESVFGPPDDGEEEEKEESSESKEKDLKTGDGDGDEADEENEIENSNNLIKNKNKRKIKKKLPLKNTPSNNNSNSNSTREKLQAMLDARSKGIQLAPRLSQTDLKSSLNGRQFDRRFSDDDDLDFGKGLIITDDLDLSPSRLKANGLSFKFKNSNSSSSSGRASMGSSDRRVSNSSTTKYGSGISKGNPNERSSQQSISGFGKPPRTRNQIGNSSSSISQRVPPNSNNLTNPSRFISSSPIPNQQNLTSPPSSKITNPSSSPGRVSAFHQHQPHLSSASSSSGTNVAKSSPPRALSAYSHLPGLGPRKQQLQGESRNSLRNEKSVGNLGLLSRNSISRSNSNLIGSSSNQIIQQDLNSINPNPNILLTRPKPLSRKRSLPDLNPSSTTTTTSSSSFSSSSQIPTTSTLSNPLGTGSGNLKNLQKKKSGSTESLSEFSTSSTSFKNQNDPSTINKPRFNEQYPPSRPNTPTGAMRYAVPTVSSLARRNQTISNVETNPNSNQNSNSSFNFNSNIASSSTSSKKERSHKRGTYSLSSTVDSAIRGIRRRQKSRNYGDGHELDGFDDLPISPNTNNSNEKFNLNSGFKVDSSSSQSPGFGIGNGNISNSSNTPAWRKFASPLTTTRIGVGNLGKDSKNQSKFQMKSGDDTIKSKSNLNPKQNPFQSFSSNPSTKNRKSQNNQISKRPTLVSYLGGNSTSNSKIGGILSPKTTSSGVGGGGGGDMKWNSIRQKWEGNETDLKVFEQVLNSSSVPALISSSTSTSKFKGSSNHLNLNSNSINSLKDGSCGSGIGNQSSLRSGSGSKIVGDMIFDQVKMCWLPKPGYENQEPDVFELMELDDDNFGDDDDSNNKKTEENPNEIQEEKLERNLKTRVSIGASSIISSTDLPHLSSNKEQEFINPKQNLDLNDDEDDEEVVDEEEQEIELLKSLENQKELNLIDEEFKKICLEAEKRHRNEMKGFIINPNGNSSRKIIGSTSSTSASSFNKPQNQTKSFDDRNNLNSNSSSSSRLIDEDQKDRERLLNRREKDLFFVRKWSPPGGR